jgi:predicted RNase H-like nuclease (RuvC/YqgF family)
VEKEAGNEDIVRIVSAAGIPSIIATDVNPAPHFVSKVAARFNVKVFTPAKSMTAEEKRQIGKHIDDVHVRDAYAAAIKAFREYANRLRQIDMTMDDLSAREKDRLKHFVIHGRSVHSSLQGD